MRTYILWGIGLSSGVFALLFVFVGIPILAHMDEVTEAPDVLLRQAGVVAPVSDECRKLREQAYLESKPLVDARNAANAEQNKIAARGSILQPVNTTFPADKYLFDSDRPRYEELSNQYFELGKQIDAIERKYACT